MNEQRQAICRVREFNRFYMARLHLLDRYYLESECTPTEARILFEVYEHDGCNAAYIAKAMNIDKGYLSRMVKAHEKNGYLRRTASEEDARSSHLHLTEMGRKKTEDFIQASNRQIEEIMGPLEPEEYRRLMEALDTVTGILNKRKEYDR